MYGWSGRSQDEKLKFREFNIGNFCLPTLVITSLINNDKQTRPIEPRLLDLAQSLLLSYALNKKQDMYYKTYKYQLICAIETSLSQSLFIQDKGSRAVLENVLADRLA